MGQQRVITRVGSWPGQVCPSRQRNTMCPHVLRTFWFQSSLLTSPGPPAGGETRWGGCSWKDCAGWEARACSRVGSVDQGSAPIPRQAVVDVLAENGKRPSSALRLHLPRAQNKGHKPFLPSVFSYPLQLIEAAWFPPKQTKIHWSIGRLLSS